MSEKTEKTKKALTTEPYKGVRDFYPEDMAAQNYIYDVWREVSEKFSYLEYSASLLEYSELYRSKGNDEIINEQTYSFRDRGGREVTLRPEMTPTLARMVAARRKSLKFPLRWYSIPNVFRYERPQRGRRREHWQLNCDLLGVPEPDGDAEIIKLAYEVMRAFGAKDEDFEIRINSRKFIKSLAAISTFDSQIKTEDVEKELLRVLDSYGKVPEEETRRAIEKLNIPASILSADYFQSNAHKNTKSGIPELVSELEKIKVKNVRFDPKIARGFDYYTGMVFEVFDTSPENRRSLFGGGRYDNLLEIFGVEPVPTVGFGMGDVTIKDFLTTHNLPLNKL